MITFEILRKKRLFFIFQTNGISKSFGVVHSYKTVLVEAKGITLKKITKHIFMFYDRH